MNNDSKININIIAKALNCRKSYVELKVVKSFSFLLQPQFACFSGMPKKREAAGAEIPYCFPRVSAVAGQC